MANDYKYHLEITVSDKTEQKMKVHTISANSVMELMSKFTIKLMSIQQELYEKKVVSDDDIPF